MSPLHKTQFGLKLVSHFQLRLWLVVSWVLLAWCGPGLVMAQEEDLDPSRRLESEKSPEERYEDQKRMDMIMGKGLDNVEKQLRFIQRPFSIGPFPSKGCATTVFAFGYHPSLAGRTIDIRSNYGGDFQVNSLSDPYTKDYFFSDDLIVLEGSVTSEDEAWMKRNKLNYVIRTEVSVNRTFTDVTAAASLAYTYFNTHNSVIINGLPYEEGFLQSRRELLRMGLVLNPKAWKEASQRIASATNDFAMERATRESILREFQEGTRNILFIIAHSDSHSIYLPGRSGTKITLEELSKIKRDIAPGRAIVLLTCNTGQVNGPTISVAEVLLKNRLAKIVLASDDTINAAEVPSLMERLRSNPRISDVFVNLRKIVNLVYPQIRASITEFNR